MVDVIASTKLVDGNLDDGAVNNFANFSEIFTLLPASACSKLKESRPPAPLDPTGILVATKLTSFSEVRVGSYHG